ncbi:MAG: hypothetical protein K2X82_19230 [Gemmataceae bacterium]|nr:hypothetical protein [Gemmataceae bacterium]
MQPLGSPLSLGHEVPNLELLRRAGWLVSTAAGAYCVAWRGRDEVVFQWRDGGWHRVGGQGAAAA